MELKEKITLDMLTKDSVSVLKQKFIEINGTEMQVGGNVRNAYMNCENDRKILKPSFQKNIITPLWQYGRFNICQKLLVLIFQNFSKALILTK